MKYIAAAAAALVLSIPAHATVQTYEFTASVSHLGDIAAFQFVPSASGRQQGSVINVNDKVVGRFSYDNGLKAITNSDSWDWNPVSTNYGYSSAPSPANAFSFTVLPSGQSVTVGDPNTPVRKMSLYDVRPHIDFASDSLWMNISGINMEYVEVKFLGLTQNWAANGILPDHLSLSDMSRAAIQHDYYKPDGGRIMMLINIDTLNQVAVTAVPEPGTWALMLAGLALLGVSTRRKRT